MGGMMGGRERQERGGSIDAWGWAAAIALALALATMAVLILRQRRPVASEAARGILDRRYARGELTREEYLERRRDLET